MELVNVNMEPLPKLCEKCGQNPGTELMHSCPFDVDVEGDTREACNCCEQCCDNCADDI